MQPRTRSSALPTPLPKAIRIAERDSPASRDSCRSKGRCSLSRCEVFTPLRKIVFWDGAGSASLCVWVGGWASVVHTYTGLQPCRQGCGGRNCRRAGAVDSDGRRELVSKSREGRRVQARSVSPVLRRHTNKERAERWGDLCLYYISAGSELDPSRPASSERRGSE
jgi:hypothetical protein